MTESNSEKRPISEGSDNDEAIGPCIADAAPSKKRKGKCIGFETFPGHFILNMFFY